MNVGVKRLADLRGGAGEVYDQTILIDAIDGEAVPLQPVLNDLSILRRDPEALA